MLTLLLNLLLSYIHSSLINYQHAYNSVHLVHITLHFTHHTHAHQPITNLALSAAPFWSHLLIHRVGQHCLYTPYITVYLVIALPKIPYIHRVYIWFWPTLPPDTPPPAKARPHAPSRTQPFLRFKLSSILTRAGEAPIRTSRKLGRVFAEELVLQLLPLLL